MEGVYHHAWQSSFSSVRLKHMNHKLLPSWGGSVEARMLSRRAGIRTTVLRDEGAGVSTTVPCLLGLPVRSRQHRWPQAKRPLPKRSPVRGRWELSRSGEWQQTCKLPPFAKVLRQNAWRGLELKGFRLAEAECARMATTRLRHMLAGLPRPL